MPSVLLVDDEPTILHAFQRAFRGGAIAVRTASSAAEAQVSLERERPDAIVLDVNLPDASGLQTFRRLKKIDARIPIILITGHGTTELAIEAMKEGAFEYLLKPLELPELRELIDRALRSSRLMSTPAALPNAEVVLAKGDLLVGRCPAMQEVYKAIGRVAGQDVTVLITGESGTGKELVARAIYQHSPRAERSFLAINCAAIPESLLESELFGHERGAFTGADRKRIGKFEQANGGTIFLDEVGEMAPLTQAKILRLIQEQTFERVGGEETIKTDVRIIAATNSDLDRMADDGRFRKDLYFRLNVFRIPLPPLRERGDDIVLLANHYLHQFAREFDKPVPEYGAGTMELLQEYTWPGNVRELQSVLKQALLQMPGDVLLPEFLPPPLGAAKPSATTSTASTGGAFDWDVFVADQIASGSDNIHANSVERMEREVLLRVLRHTNGNQLQAAKLLGITRGSLRTKIRAWGINIERTVWSDDNQRDS
jgi:two-component system nitrogen regulation response regulator GlnG